MAKTKFVRVVRLFLFFIFRIANNAVVKITISFLYVLINTTRTQIGWKRVLEWYLLVLLKFCVSLSPHNQSIETLQLPAIFITICRGDYLAADFCAYRRKAAAILDRLLAGNDDGRRFQGWFFQHDRNVRVIKNVLRFLRYA